MRWMLMRPGEKENTAVKLLTLGEDCLNFLCSTIKKMLTVGGIGMGLTIASALICVMHLLMVMVCVLVCTLITIGLPIVLILATLKTVMSFGWHSITTSRIYSAIFGSTQTKNGSETKN
nr:MAG TPA: hypothetical protein [Caudoviricetes sp.]